MKRDLYTDVSARILAELETGTVPWVKPWRATPGLNQAHNAITSRPYSGVNIVLLWMAMQRNPNWTVPRFLTFKQALALGGNVRKGEHGTKVYFVKRLIVRDKSEPSNSDDARRTFSMLREYTVFNIAQCEKLPDRVVTPKPIKPRNNDARNEDIDAFLKATGADIRDNGDVAAFYPSRDFIGMPTFASFNSGDAYYGVTFHELGHWTGHKTRIDRDLSGRFGDRKYAAEELIAELCSAFLCAEFSIDGALRHADYIKSWIELLKHDNRAFFTAASKAQQAADYLRNKMLADNDAGGDEAIAA